RSRDARTCSVSGVGHSRLRTRTFDGRGGVMSYRAARLIVATGLALLGSTAVEAQTVVTPLFPGITHIKRTEQSPPFQCPGCPAPTPNPRMARMNILLIDLTAPEIHLDV